ncbi:hypothetical protein [Endozoicomonas sp. 8E]|uniref:hypothetical protein n=1 Tax=Endozoicomonas sp. 8E TaxID=3035692 RepID=UPI002938F8DE|nr:hypothetical protein [Endozoicomonas sp. 8E]WOG28968.1 hypothetical protein P6910_04705 [Endozoicomonas sp. 8E]
MMDLLRTGSVPFSKKTIADKLEQIGSAATKLGRHTVGKLKRAYGYMKTGDFSHTHYPEQSSSSDSTRQFSERAIARPPSERGVVRPASKPAQPGSNGNDLAARLESLKSDCSRAHTGQDLLAMKQKTADLLNDARIKLQDNPEADKILQKLNTAAHLLDASSEADNHVHEAADSLQKVLLDIKFDELSQLRDQHQQIIQIEKEVADVCGMMKTLQGLVYKQGEEVSRIEDNITRSSENVKGAGDSLDSAQKSAKKARKLKIVLGIVLAVVGITLLACLL